MSDSFNDEALADFRSLYEDAFRVASDTVPRLSLMRGKSLHTTLTEIQNQIDCCQMNLSEMKAILRNNSGDSALTSKWQSVVAQFDEDLSVLKSEFESKKAVATKDSLIASDAVFGGGGDLQPYQSREDVARLKDVHKQESANTSLLIDAHQQALDAEQTAVGTLEELHTQRTTIERIKSNLAESDSLMSRTYRGLRRMRRRQILMSFMWCFLMLALAGVIGIIVWQVTK